MKKLFIHIGTHKTATTWLQHFLGMNAEHLEDLGYYYPKTGRVHHAQHRIAQAIFQRQNPAGAIDALPIWQRFKRELELTRYENIVISSEEFEWVQDPKLIRNLLPDIEIHVICYLRRQDDYLESLYGQQIRDYHPRLTMTVNEYCEKPLDFLNYLTLVKRWEDVADQTYIRVFDRKFMSESDIGCDFLKTIGAGEGENFIQPSGPVIDHKSSLTLSALEFVRHCNRLALTEPYHNRLVNQVIRLDKVSKAKGVRAQKQRLLDIGQRTRLLSVYMDGNRKIAQQYPNATGLRDLFAPIENNAEKFIQRDAESDIEIIIKANSLVPLK